jgi:DNA invertase Pin-like site-specific DNA recombinase
MAKTRSATTQENIAVRYCLYARKSMEDEERQALSIDSQLNEMRKIAERDGLMVAIEKIESHSAKDSGTRKVFNQMIGEIKEGKYNAILTWNPDRLSRNAGDLGKLVDLMDQQRLFEIRTFNQKFSNTPNEKFLLMILCSQAKLENDNKRDNVQRGLRARAQMGLFPTSTPIGYLTSNDRNRPCEKDIDPVRAPVVREMFEKVAYERYSCHDVLRWLEKINFRSPNNKLVSLSTVQNILRRTFYYGQYEYPRGSGTWYQGIHTPIVTKELFERAQEQMEHYNHGHAKGRKSTPESFAFLRLIRCGNCGAGITGSDTYKHLKNGKVLFYRYYACTQGKSRWCREPSINEVDLIAQLLEMFDQLDIDLIGTRAQLEAEIEKWYRIDAFVSGQPVPERSRERKEMDLRGYAKAIFEDGSVEERRAMLQHLKSRLILKDKHVYLDTLPAEIAAKVPQPPEDVEKDPRLVIRRGRRLPKA